MLIHRCRFVDFTPHSITALAFNHRSTSDKTPADLRLAVGRANGDIEIYNPRYNWFHETTFRGGKDRSIEGLVWVTVDGESRLFSTGGATSITEWDLSTGLPLANHECNSGVIWSISSSPDGKYLAAGCDNGSVTVLDISGGPGVADHYKILQRQPSRVMSLVWLNNEQLVGGCSDGKIRVWSMKSGGRIVATMKVDKSKNEETLVWSVLVLNNGAQIVSGDSTGSVKFWDGTNFSLSKSFKVHEADVLCLAADADSQTVFSGGVDRKIACYKHVGQTAEKKRWVNVCSRLLHSNDIRSIAAYQSASSGYLISGGVERSLVITGIKNFENGIFRKMSITRQKPSIFSVPGSRYVAMWNDQSVKIWVLEGQISDDGEAPGKHLVSKITLNTEEYVTNCLISDDGSVLVVCTSAEIKVFDLSKAKSSAPALKVSKRDIPALKNQGAKYAKFVPRSRSLIVIVTPDNEIILYDLTKEIVVQQFDIPEESASSLGHLNSISHIAINDNFILATARSSGSIDLFELKKGKHIQNLVHLKTPISALDFTLTQSLVIVTASHKVLEYDMGSSALTEWSRRNSELIPRELINQPDKCCGIFTDQSTPSRIWLWGSNWLAFLDLSVNIPIQRVVKRKLLHSEKDDRTYSISSNGSAISSPASPSVGGQPFWITQKYRPVVYANSLGSGEIVVCERPASSLPSPPAFWSNHKITL